MTRVTVLVYYEDFGYWSAQCLEHDISVHRIPDRLILQQKMRQALSQQVLEDLRAGRAPFAMLSPAPEKFYDQALRAHTLGPDLPLYIGPTLIDSGGQVHVRVQFLVMP